jgi:enoyl-CoA hydratase/carnithine racemase
VHLLHDPVSAAAPERLAIVPPQDSDPSSSSKAPPAPAHSAAGSTTRANLKTYTQTGNPKNQAASQYRTNHPSCPADALSRAVDIARRIAGNSALLGVKATLASARLALQEGDSAAIERLRPDVTALFGTADAAEGVQSFVELRQARFQGR